MKTREVTKAAAETLPPARPAPPGELAKAGPAAPASTGAGETAEAAAARHRKLRGLSGLYAALAALSLVAGEEFDAMFWATFALYFALAGETRWRVPRLVRYSAVTLIAVLTAVKLVLLILRFGGR